MAEDVDPIIDAYLKALEKQSYQMMFGISEKLLPYTVKTIKEAIKRKLALVLVKGHPDQALIQKLKSAYVDLAKFISFQEFGLDPDIYAGWTAKFFQIASTEDKNKALKITEKIRRDRESLEKEINAWCRDFQV